MKKIILLLILSIACFNALNAQTYYRMYISTVPPAGSQDWIANVNMRNSETSGIDFTTAQNARGFVTAMGKWGFINNRHTGTYKSFVDFTHSINDLTMAVQGSLYTENLTIGNFNQKFWTSIGIGRNNDFTINNNNSKWMRIGSKGGISLWGKEGVTDNDTPQVIINGQRVSCNVPFHLQPGTGVEVYFGLAKDDHKEAWIGTVTNSGLHIGAADESAIYIGTDNKIFLGLSEHDIKSVRKELKDKFDVFVNRGILSEDFAIAPKSSWPDFVFQNNFTLRTLHEVEQFIKEKKHLPDVPSAQKVSEEGYSQHEMNKVLLQKVEELTLYVIELEKQVNALKRKE